MQIGGVAQRQITGKIDPTLHGGYVCGVQRSEFTSEYGFQPARAACKKLRVSVHKLIADSLQINVNLK